MDQSQLKKQLQSWDIPGLDGVEATHVTAEAGQATVIVGANGAGKSALGWRLEKAGNDVRRLIAHRRLWLEAAGPDVTSSQRQAAVSNMKSWSMDPSSRYLDHGHQQRSGVVLFDFLARFNYENATIADAARKGVGPEGVGESASVLDRLNSIFSGAGIPVSFSLTEYSTIEAKHSLRDATYPISQMSDGEKSALLLAAEILSGPAQSTFIIDEPERHLHRSISAGLIASIMADRSDCHFVILTHDLDLAASLPEASTNKYVLTDCMWQGQTVIGWEMHAASGGGIPEEARRAVLGGRSQILFLEGQSTSLDSGLHRLLYPNLTLAPVGSCEQVIRAVGGVKDSSEHHWLQAAGIVDADGRATDEIAVLHQRGILVLPVSEIESLYYSKPVMEAVARHQAESLGRVADEIYRSAVAACLKAMGDGDSPERLCASVAEKLMYRRVSEQLPGRQAIAGSGATVTIKIDSPYQDLLATYKALLAASDLEGLLRWFPVRDTSARSAVANALRFKSYADYEGAALARIRADKELVSTIRNLVGAIPF